MDGFNIRKVLRYSSGFLLGLLLAIYVPLSDRSSPGFGIAVAQDDSGSKKQETRKVSGINAKTYEKFAEAQELFEADNYSGALKILDEIKGKKKLSSAEAIQLYSFYGVVYFSKEDYKKSI